MVLSVGCDPPQKWSNNPDIAPPVPSDSSTYDDYKRTLGISAAYTSIEKQKQGMDVFLTLSPSDKKLYFK